MRKSKRVVALGMVAALGLIAAACGGDDDDSGGATTTAGGGATTTAGAATTAGGATTSAAAPDIGELLSYDESAQCGRRSRTPATWPRSRRSTRSTVKFTLCNPDVAFPAKVAFSAFGIHPAEYLEATGGTGDLIEKPDRHRPVQARGVGARQPDRPRAATTTTGASRRDTRRVVFRWSAEAAQRLVELQSGTVDGIDNVGTDDFETVAGDSNLQLIERDPLNVFYLGINVDKPPFDDEQVRQAIG